jgi:tRNA-2-methylthio-N6-dimethylallyladenosine synthase
LEFYYFGIRYCQCYSLLARFLLASHSQNFVSLTNGKIFLMKNRVYIETYGCQMNLADTEVVLSILKKQGFEIARTENDANVILINTCSVRDNAEQRVLGRLGNLKKIKEKTPEAVIGVIGCMAERLRDKLIDEKLSVDLVVGPDEYRKLPDYLDMAFNGAKAIGVRLSKTETYDDIVPYREDGLSAWISVMRGCDKFCTYCVVPFTRGRERSRSLRSVVNEVRDLSARGFREVTLLGQNVNSYNDDGNDFANLLQAVAEIDRNIRIRFTTSHPQDLSDKLLRTIAENSNLCKYIHLPVQSGSDRILKLMNRTYTIEHYLNLIERARELMPEVSFSTDIIAGFPTETEEEHSMTLDVIRRVRYDGAFMFKYSPREGTKAYRMKDDVPEEVKTRRLNEIIALQQEISAEINRALIGKEQIVLVEGFSRKSNKDFSGRTDGNKIAVFPVRDDVMRGDYVRVKITDATSATLKGEIVGKLETLEEATVQTV